MFYIKMEHKNTATLFAKILPTFCFGYFGHIWPLPSKTMIPACRNFMQKMDSLPNFFFRDIVKILQIYYFEYFENA